VLFSEPKIPQSQTLRFQHRHHPTRFSALQRAENSSIAPRRVRSQRAVEFQCSSASRKFLNVASARTGGRSTPVSVLFSEPKIPQFLNRAACAQSELVSVLFSEPKIPQSSPAPLSPHSLLGSFSALQRAENSSIVRRPSRASASVTVSVLFSEPKIPQSSR